MNVLAEITAETLGLAPVPVPLDSSSDIRKSARAILLDAEGRMAIQYLRAHGFHKLPGGGIEEGETAEVALVREIREEVGCGIQIEESLGVVIEHRDMQNLMQSSECFIARVNGKIEEPQLEDAEIAEGLETLWVLPEEALSLLEQDVPPVSKAHFIRARELAFVRAYLDRKAK